MEYKDLLLYDVDIYRFNTKKYQNLRTYEKGYQDARKKYERLLIF